MRSQKIAYLLMIILIAGFFRFYKLDWGEGYFFHPDEYHIGISVNQMSFPDRMHPNFFAYGTFISYLIYFSKSLATSIGLIQQSYNPILIGRFFSAIFSTATIPLVFLLTKRLTKRDVSAYVAASLTALSPGLVQQAHFATPESILIFWLLLSVLLIIKWVEKDLLRYLLLSSVSFGLALSVKISGLVLLPALFLAIVINDRVSLNNLPKKVLRFFVIVATASVVFFLVYPYSVLDWRGFRYSMEYETGVGWGDPVVFYTRQFINTTPFMFQFTKILPYVLDPLTLLAAISGVAYSIYKIIKSKSGQAGLSIVLSSFLLLFSTNSFLFAKWTRFLIPSVPFFAVFAGITVDNPRNKELTKIAGIALILSAFMWTWMFFGIYLDQDVRLKADRWLNDNLPGDSMVLTESGNMIEVPISRPGQKYSFDFYHLDEDQELQAELARKLEESDYFIIQSRRIYFNHLRLSESFPVTANFYNRLFSGNLGFVKIKEFSSYPEMDLIKWRFELDDESAEETWSVFDHPVIRIYEKKQHFPLEHYQQVLEHTP